MVDFKKQTMIYIEQFICVLEINDLKNYYTINTCYQIPDNILKSYKIMEDSFVSDNQNKCKTQQQIYKKIKVLGQGAMGKAYLVQSNQDHKLYVMKRINIGHLQPQQKQNAMRQAQLHSIVQHPNIIAFKQIYHTTKDKLCIIMQYASGGDLDQLIKQQQGKHIAEDIVLRYFTQICLGLNTVHDKKIIHRDIKGANIFLTQDKTVKIGDFGISKISDQTLQASKTFVGTPYYLSPQMIQGKPYSSKADVWSLGVLFYQLCALKMPFDAGSLPLLALKILKGSFPPITAPYSRDLKNLILSMLQVMPSKRPTIKQILLKPFLSKYIPKNQLEQIKKTYQQKKLKPRRATPNINTNSVTLTKKQTIKSQKRIKNVPETKQQIKVRRQQAKLKRQEMRKKMKQDIDQKRRENDKKVQDNKTLDTRSPAIQSKNTNIQSKNTNKNIKPSPNIKKPSESPVKNTQKPWKVAKPSKSKKQISVQIHVPSLQPKPQVKQQQKIIPPQNDFKVQIFFKQQSPNIQKISINQHNQQPNNQIQNQSVQIQQQIERAYNTKQTKLQGIEDMLAKVNNAQKIVDGLGNQYQQHDIQLYQESQTFDSNEDVHKPNIQQNIKNNDGIQAMKYLNNSNNISENIQEIIQVLEQGLGQDNFIEAYQILKNHLEQNQQNNDYIFDRQMIRYKMPFLTRDQYDSYVVLLYTLLILEKMQMQKNFDSEDEQFQDQNQQDNQNS